MSLAINPRREKVFGSGRPLPLDRNAKVRLMTMARGLSRRTEARKHYGALTAKALHVLEALLWQFHNAKTGLCFPSIKRIAEAARCSPATVQKALRALEALGLLSWVNRLVKRREHGPAGWRWRVYRTSNGYQLNAPGPETRAKSSNANFRQGTHKPSISFNYRTTALEEVPLIEPLDRALQRLGRLVRDAEHDVGAPLDVFSL